MGNFRSGLSRRISALAMLLFPALALPTLANAQDAGTTTARTPPPCLFRTEPASDDGLPRLYASCRGRGLTLGPVSEYHVFRNEDLDATLVDIRSDGDRRIMLISFEDGQASAEDLTGQIAVAAGRNPTSHLAEVDLDLAAFANEGRITVHRNPRAAGQPEVVSVNAGQQIAAERSRSARVSGQP